MRRAISRRWRKTTPTTDNAPRTAPPAKKASRIMTSGASQAESRMKRRVVSWVLRMANTSRKEKMISRMAQVNAVMASRFARDTVAGRAGDINKKGQ